MLAGARDADSCGQDGRLTINATNGCNPYWMQSFGEPANFGYIRTKNCHEAPRFCFDGTWNVRPALIQLGFLEQQNLMLNTKKKLILNIYRINVAV